ncbi:MobF family relaxase [Ruficoccus sp. ZRK36]|uniref:MobF family relaxase n=1 Tax=Ruficoccus sp. ZRK36 TaxID=2866311 RepID=UPI001C72A5FC|nr:MobF family relaxase [Ruficoccus sp. ZRK36]QYY35479.1 relaxase domain-containing protein [Ruficoccus sp. ZRK36]
MLSPKPQYNLRNAKEYFREHLQVGDYYAQENEVQGEWFGQGAEKLGLQGTVKEREFVALCEGNNPANNERLTARKNTTRTKDGKEVANRRIFYDFTISPPKSVSIAGLYQDVRIVNIHDKAVQKAMQEMEKFAMTRVRKNGRSDDRTTGNVIGAAFRHDTSRALDPHLHTHCIVMNATYDAVENRWKALQNYEMLKAQKFVENLYYHELTKGLKQLGYVIENNARDFEIRSISPELIERFSKRHQQIDAGVREHLSSGNRPKNLKELRAQIAHEKRDRKIKESSASNLHAHWSGQMTHVEIASLAPENAPNSGDKITPDMGVIVNWADERVFERKSVVEDYQLKAAALIRGRGEDFTLEKLNAEIARRNYLKNERDHTITTHVALDRELQIVATAQNERNQHAPFCENYQPSIATITGEQKSAVERILGSQDYVTLFRGGAGTGKTFALQEVAKGLENAGHSVVVLAPQRQQVIDLQNDGFAAQTVARFLAKSDLPSNAVVVIDEAGQIGGKQMSDLFTTLKASETRIILSGDTRQHGAVEASDALRAIEKHAGLHPAELTAIRRQDPAKGRDENERVFIGEYREAVKAASKGEVVESFERLDSLDCVIEVDEANRQATLADDYLQARQAGESTLIVAQTWDEIHAVNDAVRQRLKEADLLGAESKLAFYESRDLDNAQKRDARFYEPGDHVYFIKKYGRFGKGELAKVERASEQGFSLRKDGKVTTVGFKQSKHFVVARQRELELAPGDRLQMKFNGKSVDGKPIVNGELVTVSRIAKNGNIAVIDDRGQRKTLAPTQRLANLGYAVTSYASQGKTVDTVLFSDSQNRAATNRNQWYVSISRARRKIKIYTSDKEALRENLLRLGERTLAMDFMEAKRKGGQLIRQGIDHAKRAREIILQEARQQLLKKQRLAPPAPRQAIKPLRSPLRRRQQSRGIRQSM